MNTFRMLPGDLSIQKDNITSELKSVGGTVAQQVPLPWVALLSLSPTVPGLNQNLVYWLSGILHVLPLSARVSSRSFQFPIMAGM